MFGIRRRARRGNMALVVSLSLTTLVGVGAVVIDVGYTRVVRQQLENAADAAAFAAAARLDGTEEGLAEARATAVWIAAENLAGGRPVEVDANVANDEAGQVVLGNYDADQRIFTATDDPEEVNAVRVRARVPDLGLLLSPVAFGIDSVPLTAASRTFSPSGGAGAATCYLPISMPACLVDRYGTSGLQDVMLKLQPAGIDNVGYGRPDASPSASWVRSQLGDCEQSGEVEIGDDLNLQNGQVTTALGSFVGAVETGLTRWDTEKWGTMPPRSANSAIAASKYGRTFEGVMPVFDGGAAYCSGSGGSYSGTAPVAGFVWAAVYDVVNSGGAANRTIKLRLDFTRTYNAGTTAGGPSWGVVSLEAPRRIADD